MENTKYTPGPWEVDYAKDGDSRYYIIHGQLPKGINGDFGYPICDSMNRHHCIAPDEDAANFTLIATAPELLAQLKALVGQIEHSNYLVVPPAVQAVIAKAEGR